MTSPSLPKVLILSFSGLGSQNATGQLIADFFERWPRERLLQVYWAHHPRNDTVGIDAAKVGSDDIQLQIKQFQPDVIYLRPADNHIDYARLSVQICEQINAPVVTHIMDDWPARNSEREHGAELVAMLERVINLSHTNVTICQEMSAAYEHRYRRVFQHLANGVDPNTWRQINHQSQAARFCIRYCGALADDMQQRSILDICAAVEELVDSGVQIDFEIYTMPWFKDIPAAFCESCASISVHDLVAKEHYPELLGQADALILAYNFDARSKLYTQYSFANKTPECLASGTPVIAYGPQEIPSIRHIAENGIGTVVTSQSLENLKQAILSIKDNPAQAQAQAVAAQEYTFQNQNLDTVRDFFESLLIHAAEAKPAMRLKQFTREDDVAVDETAVIYDYFRTNFPNTKGTMIDVGAHHGSAFKPFLDDGWNIHAFEPDPTNHAYITQRLASESRLKLNQFAVGHESGKVLSFYASEQSTGISSLIPFHEGHKEVARVNTIRLDEYLAGTDVSEIDFLKIDTEGFDLRVLQGFDWKRFKPRVIECEFEDAKTLNIGYDFHEQAKFLLDKGYTVFVSEWHPIVRYGIRHQWRQLVSYPTDDIKSDSWGNFVAFRDTLPMEDIAAHFHTLLAEKNPGKELLAAAPVVVQGSPPGSISEPANSQVPQPAPQNPPPATPNLANQDSPMVSKQTGFFGNHLGIFFDFLGSRPGLITGLGLAVTFFCIMLLPTLLSTGSIDWRLLVAAGIGLVSLLHVFGYLLERTRHERDQDNQKTMQLSTLHRQVADVQNKLINPEDVTQLSLRVEMLNTKVEQQAHTPSAQPNLTDGPLQSMGRQISELEIQVSELEKELLRVQTQNLDIKRKLPEIVQMINNTHAEFEN